MSEVSVFEGALERMMATGSPAAVARSVSTEGQMLLGPYRSVLSASISLPASPSAGDSYIIPSGVHFTQIALFGSDGIWHYSTPSIGDIAYVQDALRYYSFLGGGWVPSPIISGLVAGLVFDGSDQSIKLNAIFQIMKAFGGGVLSLDGPILGIGGALGTSIRIPNNTAIVSPTIGICSIDILSTWPIGTSVFIADATLNSNSNRLAKNISFKNLLFDGAALTFPIWLSSAGGNPINDPQNDYWVNGGNIFNPAYGQVIDSLCLSQTAAGAGALSFNGRYVSAGTANLAPAVRRIIVGCAANIDLSGLTFTVTGTGYFDNPLVANGVGPGLGLTKVILTNIVSGSAFAPCFKTVTGVTISGSSTGNAFTVGTETYTAFGVMAANRRNPVYNNPTNYTVQSPIIDMIKVDGGRIEDCIFMNWKNVAGYDKGCRDFYMRGNTFINCGKGDGPFPGWHTTSFGDAQTPPTGYQDCENTIHEDMACYTMGRMGLMYEPTIGGRLINYLVDTCHESGLFIGGNADQNGGTLQIINPIVRNVSPSDIVAHGIEVNARQGGAAAVKIISPEIVNMPDVAIQTAGANDVEFEGPGLIQNCGGIFTFPYGPFSERGFTNSAIPIFGPPVAGTTIVRPAIQWAQQIGETSSNIRIAHLRLVDTRPIGQSAYTIIQQTTSGAPITGCRNMEFSHNSVWELPLYTTATVLNAKSNLIAANGLPFTLNVTGVTANPTTGYCLIRTTSTAFMMDGTYYSLASIVGTTEANGVHQVSVNADGFTFLLVGVPFVHAYTSGGTITGCIVLTVNKNVGIRTNDTILVASVGGATESNGTWTNPIVTGSNLIYLPVARANNYTSGGTVSFGNAAVSNVTSNITPLTVISSAQSAATGWVRYQVASTAALTNGQNYWITSDAGTPLAVGEQQLAVVDATYVDVVGVAWVANGTPTLNGLCRLTVGNTAGLSTGFPVLCRQVVGTTEANSNAIATVINSTTVDLQGVFYRGYAYVSGGVLTWATAPYDNTLTGVMDPEMSVHLGQNRGMSDFPVKPSFTWGAANVSPNFFYCGFRPAQVTFVLTNLSSNPIGSSTYYWDGTSDYNNTFTFTSAAVTFAVTWNETGFTITPSLNTNGFTATCIAIPPA